MLRYRENGAYFFYKELFLALLPDYLKKSIHWTVQYELAHSTFSNLPHNIREVFNAKMEKEKMSETGGRLNAEEKNFHLK